MTRIYEKEKADRVTELKDLAEKLTKNEIIDIFYDLFVEVDGKKMAKNFIENMSATARLLHLRIMLTTLEVNEGSNKKEVKD